MFVVESPAYLRTNIAFQHESGAGEVLGGVIGPCEGRVYAQGKSFDVASEANGAGAVDGLVYGAGSGGGRKKRD
jgi:hypothetical protein